MNISDLRSTGLIEEGDENIHFKERGNCQIYWLLKLTGKLCFYKTCIVLKIMSGNKLMSGNKSGWISFNTREYTKEQIIDLLGEYKIKNKLYHNKTINHFEIPWSALPPIENVDKLKNDIEKIDGINNIDLTYSDKIL